ncbi:MAG: pseudouridine synthase [Pontibacterium sp.]
MRLDKFVSQSADISRKDVKKYLKQGLISVDGEVVKHANLKVSPSSYVSLDGFPLEAPRDKYFMLYKPEGLVCANTDPTHPTVISCLDEPRADELILCGRLDIDTTGLLLITNDGAWAHKVTSPRHKMPKVYEVTTADPIDPEAIAQFEQGIRLKDEHFPTKPAILEITGECSANVTLTEGRYHQVKRMFGAIGNRVTSLHRRSIGDVELDYFLEPGQYRELTDEELAALS